MEGTPAHGSMDSGGAPAHIVRGTNSNCTAVSFHQHNYSGAPLTLGYLAAGCSLADSPITAGANRTCSLGLLSSLALMIPMILSACSEGADFIWSLGCTLTQRAVKDRLCVQEA